MSDAKPGGDLKLAATDAEDITVLSALLQDAVIPISEMVYLAKEGRFALVANRFRWENLPLMKVAGQVYERVCCGVMFDHVKGVRRQNLAQEWRDQMFELLALKVANGYVDLVFSGNAIVRLDVERILCHAEDFGEPWPTQWLPEHDRSESAKS
jgi:hypothetical protein